MSAREPLTLRPGRARVVTGLIGSTVLMAISIGALTCGALVVGLLALVIFALFFLAYALRLLHPRSGATRLDAEGFRVWSIRGQLLYTVPWERVAELGSVPSYGAWGRAAELVGFRCEPRLARRGCHLARRQLGDFDGCLPDYYGGFDATLELMLEYLPHTGARTPSGLDAAHQEADPAP
jgi:hypothetical protein